MSVRSREGYHATKTKTTLVVLPTQQSSAIGIKTDMVDEMQAFPFSFSFSLLNVPRLVPHVLLLELRRQRRKGCHRGCYSIGQLPRHLELGFVDRTEAEYAAALDAEGCDASHSPQVNLCGGVTGDRRR